MSWSFHGVGKPAAVAARAKGSLSSVRCSEPEETIKAKVIEIIETSLTAFPDATAVQIEASGSQSTHSDQPGKATNTLSVKITPLWGFVE